MKLVGAPHDIKVLSNLHQILLSKHAKTFIDFLNKQGLPTKDVNALIFLLKSISFEVNQNELSMLNGMLESEKKFGFCEWAHLENTGIKNILTRCETKLAESETNTPSKPERIEKSDKSNIEDFFKQLHLAKPPKDDIRIFREEKDDKKDGKESVFSFFKEKCTDDKETREAHKDVMSTKNGTSQFGFWTKPQNFNPEQTKTTSVNIKKEENEKLTLETVYVPFKEISKDKAVTENIRYIKVKEKLDVMTNDEINAVIAPILKRISREIPKERNSIAFLLLKTIGRTGVYTTTDLDRELIKDALNAVDFEEFQRLKTIIGKPSVLQNYLMSLYNSQLLDRLDPLPPSGRGRSAIPYVLSSDGKLLYTYIYKENPVESLYVTMSQSEKSIELQTNIKKAVDVLELNGFDCFLKDRIDLPDGRSSICDILAQKNGNQFRIEVDDGMDNAQNYFEKFEKILIVDNWLIFITPNKKVKNRLKEIFMEFVKTRINEGLIGLKKANKKYIFLSIPELQSLPNKFYDKLVGKE